MRLSVLLLLGLVSATYGLPRPDLLKFLGPNATPSDAQQMDPGGQAGQHDVQPGPAQQHAAAAHGTRPGSAGNEAAPSESPPDAADTHPGSAGHNGPAQQHADHTRPGSAGNGAVAESPQDAAHTHPVDSAGHDAVHTQLDPAQPHAAQSRPGSAGNGAAAESSHEVPQPVATYTFIECPTDANPGNTMKTTYAFEEQRRKASIGVIEHRVFSPIGIMAKPDVPGGGEPLSLNRCWRLTTEGAALVIERHSHKLIKLMFAAEAARMSLDTYWVVPTPVNMKIDYGRCDTVHFLDYPGGGFPIPNTRQTIDPPWFRIPEYSKDIWLSSNTYRAM
ncbi:hypothetical protein FB446DRAFT_849943 [Lentinula raphanica]|nr:hypothetical protein FB446DRAFT_849943 [Lentinula raphanica]